MPIILVNPFDETRRTQQPAARRLDSLNGKTIGLLDISKPGGSLFLDRVEQLLSEGYGVAQFFRLTKLTFARVASEDVIERMMSRRCDAVIEALAD